MPVTFRFAKETTPKQAQSLLHQIGSLQEVETFGEIDHAHAPDGELAGFVIFERSGDSDDEDAAARREIARQLERSPHTLDVEVRASQ